jgi:UDP-N-acetylmuramate dehydrogenase
MAEGKGKKKKVKPAPSAPSAPARPAGKPRAKAAPARAPRGIAKSFPVDRLQGATKFEEPLAKHTTFRIGGPAAILFAPAGPEAVAEAVAWAKREGVPWMALGLGSDVLARDGGFPGLVIKIGKGLDTLTQKAGTWKAGAGLPTPLLARRTAEAGFAGVHRLIGVPGTVGGGVFMNAGAHGQDFSLVLTSATVLQADGQIREVPRKAIPFEYRHSGLHDEVVLGATLRLEEGDPVKVRGDLGMYLKRRREGTPFDQPCCGSVFRNPEEMTAGRLIDRCGLKGRRVGGAVISEQHANYIVNKGGASADDVLKLIDIARTAVFKEYGIELILEVQVVGESK